MNKGISLSFILLGFLMTSFILSCPVKAVTVTFETVEGGTPIPKSIFLVGEDVGVHVQCDTTGEAEVYLSQDPPTFSDRVTGTTRTIDPLTAGVDYYETYDYTTYGFSEGTYYIVVFFKGTGEYFWSSFNVLQFSFVVPEFPLGTLTAVIVPFLALVLFVRERIR